MSHTGSYLYYAPEFAAAVSTEIWASVRRREIPRDYGLILECLLWRCRIPGRDRVIVSITELVARTGGVQRSDAVMATDYAHERGWLRKVARRQIVWCQKLGRNVGRQATTEFVFLTPSDFRRDTVLSPTSTKEKRRGLGAPLMAMAALLLTLQREDPARYLVLQEAIQTIQEAPRPDVEAMLRVTPALPPPATDQPAEVEPPPVRSARPAPISYADLTALRGMRNPKPAETAQETAQQPEPSPPVTEATSVEDPATAAPVAMTLAEKRADMLAQVRAAREAHMRATPVDLSRAHQRRPVLADYPSPEEDEAEETVMRRERETLNAIKERSRLALQGGSRGYVSLPGGWQRGRLT